MYLPNHFAAPDEAARRFMEAHPFVLLITATGDAPGVSHVPMLVRDEGQRLEFHLARANPQAALLAGGATATAVFHGPHAYVSPRWYAAPNVPTWNFATVHVRGTVRALDDAGTAATVAAFSREYEGPEGLGEFEQSTAYAALLKGIIGFELRVESCVGKFKLSQNRTAADREQVARMLAADPRSEVQETAAMMQALQVRAG